MTVSLKPRKPTPWSLPQIFAALLSLLWACSVLPHAIITVWPGGCGPPRNDSLSSVRASMVNLPPWEQIHVNWTSHPARAPSVLTRRFPWPVGHLGIGFHFLSCAEDMECHLMLLVFFYMTQEFVSSTFGQGSDHCVKMPPGNVFLLFLSLTFWIMDDAEPCASA